MSEINEIPPIKIAFILDNEVVDILHTDERLAAIFLSEPKMIDVTGQLVENEGIVRVGIKHDPETNTFYNEDENN